MLKIEGISREVLDKTEWVAIVTQGEDGPHLVATWGDYVRQIGAVDDKIIIPVGTYSKTEENLKKNKNIQLLIVSKQVNGTHGPGQGCRLLGEGEIQKEGKILEKVKEKFSWARGALIVKINEINTLL
ncbi:MAG: pyridoxamine 5'-phosphate oxidase family protein [Actinobacteria bacterium]|nr:pyridoxamine 5'-phosphate oxidase family protein [Actinomycetota bacterium]